MGFANKLYKKFVLGDLKNTEDAPDVKEWVEYLASLPAAKDEVDQSYNKYCCRKRYLPKQKLFLLNMASLLKLISLMPKIVFQKFSISQSNSNLLVIVEEKDVPYADIVPQTLMKVYSDVMILKKESINNGSLCKEARILFAKCIKKHPTSYYFLLLVVKELLFHSELLRRYDAKAVAVYIQERNVATPLLKVMYEQSDREIDSFMHGEYLFHLIQAYMAFSNYYVWDGSYIKMFTQDLKCTFGNCSVYIPEKYNIRVDLSKEKQKLFCTYYFSGESTTTIKRLAGIYKQLADNGYKCKVRPHPRYSHLDLIGNLFDECQIEDPAEVPIEQSLEQCEYVIGLSSTVLFEAQIAGCSVVWDDVTDHELYLNTKERCVHLRNSTVPLFSSLLRKQGFEWQHYL